MPAVCCGCTQSKPVCYGERTASIPSPHFDEDLSRPAEFSADRPLLAVSVLELSQSARRCPARKGHRRWPPSKWFRLFGVVWRCLVLRIGSWKLRHVSGTVSSGKCKSQTRYPPSRFLEWFHWLRDATNSNHHWLQRWLTLWQLPGWLARPDDPARQVRLGC